MEKVFLIEMYNDINHNWITIGVYDSLKRAENAVKDIGCPYSIVITELPLNKTVCTNNFTDQLGLFDHWHFDPIDRLLK